MQKRLTLLGSTGSIGDSTLDVVARHPERFSVYALTAHRNGDKLVEQCLRFNPEVAVVGDAATAAQVAAKLHEAGCKTEVSYGPQALVDVVQADALVVVCPRQSAPDLARFRADPVVLDGDLGLVVGVHDGDLEVARLAARLQPVMDRVLDERLQHERREHDAQHLGGDPQGDVESVAEARPLQVEVGVDQADLFGHRHELPVAAEAVADEVGELHQELPGSVRVGADEGLDRRQRVVDEVR